MAVFATRFAAPPARSTVRGLWIVAQDHVGLYQSLRHAYRESDTIAVVLDRQLGERRRAVQPVPGERRRRDRRKPVNPADDVRLRGYVIFRPYERRPHD